MVRIELFQAPRGTLTLVIGDDHAGYRIAGPELIGDESLMLWHEFRTMDELDQLQVWMDRARDLVWARPRTVQSDDR